MREFHEDVVKVNGESSPVRKGRRMDGEVKEACELGE